MELLGFPNSSVAKESAFNAGDPRFSSWDGKILWRRDKLPTAVFLGFPCGLSGKESVCNVGGLGSIPGLGRSPGERLPTLVFWCREFQALYRLYRESDTTELLSLHFMDL